jgi:hypothetical protein
VPTAVPPNLALWVPPLPTLVPRAIPSCTSCSPAAYCRAARRTFEDKLFPAAVDRGAQGCAAFENLLFTATTDNGVDCDATVNLRCRAIVQYRADR